MIRLFRLLLSAFCLLALPIPVRAQKNAQPPLLRGVGIDQRLNAPIPLDLLFRDEDGRSVRLREYFGNKPVILALVYYECPMLCTQVLDGLASSLKPLSLSVGDEFTVVMVSFNPRETPAFARGKKSAALERYGRPGAAAGWHALTGEEEGIQALTRAVGFRYAYDPRTNQYAHASAVIIVTPQGKVSRYLYGVEYAPRDVRLGLVEASTNRIGSPVDQLLLYCYQYDPMTGRYGMVIMNVIRLGGVVTVLSVGLLIFVLLRRDRKRQSAHI